MSVHIFGTWGILRTVSFTLVLLWWHFAGSSTSSRAWFSVTWWESTHVVAFSSMLFTWQEHLFFSRAVPCHFAILHQVSHTLSQSFKVELEFCFYQDSTESLILTFSLLPILLEKLVSCCLNNQNLLGITSKLPIWENFARDTMCEVLSFAGLFLVLSPRCGPKFKVCCCPLCVTYS